MVKQKILDQLKKHPNKTIKLDQLESSVTNGNVDYDEFAKVIHGFVANGILKPITPSKTNNKPNPLPLKYRIDQSQIYSDYHKTLHKKQFELNSAIHLDVYFKLSEKDYLKDLPYIEKINDYLQQRGMPTQMYIPELSFELVNDEKWIDEKGGKRVLKQIGLWDVLTFHDRIDPVAFAVNPTKVNDPIQKHLIIENKTPFLHIMKHLEKSEYATVIYGQGWKIISSMQLFEKQYRSIAKHQYEYFGDLDPEGISIYDELSSTIEVAPAAPFYCELFNRDRYQGKVNQRVNEKAIENFSSDFYHHLTQHYDQLIKKYFSGQVSTIRESVFKDLSNMFHSGNYQPQELLSEKDLVIILQKDNAVDKESK